MTSFAKFNRLPAELQDMIWDLSLPGPRVVTYQSGIDDRIERLSPFQPATNSVCTRSRQRTLKKFTPIFSSKVSNRCMGYFNLKCDTLLLGDESHEVLDDDEEIETTESPSRSDQNTADIISGNGNSWNQLRYIALSVPLFVGIISSGGYRRTKTSPFMNALYKLSSLEGIAIASSGIQEIEKHPEQATTNYDHQNVWRCLTENERKVGWDTIFEECLTENYFLGQSDDMSEDEWQSWPSLRQRIWRSGGGPNVYHVGLETPSTREEMQKVASEPVGMNDAETWLPATQAVIHASLPINTTFSLDITIVSKHGKPDLQQSRRLENPARKRKTRTSRWTAISRKRPHRKVNLKEDAVFELSLIAQV